MSASFLSRFGIPALLVAAAVVGACTAEETITQDYELIHRSANSGHSPNSCGNAVEPDVGDEGEIYGNFYYAGSIICDGGQTATLNGQTLTVDSSKHYFWDFEWWDPRDDGCDGAETGHADPEGDGDERHCITPGSVYTFSGGGRSFAVDYPLLADAGVDGGALEYSATVGGIGTSTQAWDTQINTDIAGVSGSDSPVIRYDIVTAATRYSTSFTPVVGTGYGTGDSWFRANLGASSLSWAAGGEGGLGRIYWGDGTSTNYFAMSWTGPLTRWHQFAEPASDSVVYTMGAEIMRPDEAPDGGAASGSQRTIVIYKTKPDLMGVYGNYGGLLSGTHVVQGGSIDLHLFAANGTSSPGGFGTAPSGWHEKVYLSTDTLLSAADSLILDYVRPSSMAQSTVFNKDTVAVVPAGLAAGTYYLLFDLDADSDISESNETNNLSYYSNVMTVHDSLPAPHSLSVTSVGQSSAHLSWTVGSFGDSFGHLFTVVEINSGSGWVLADTTFTRSTDSAQTTLTGLTPSTTYSVRLRHVWKWASTIYSAWETVTDAFETTEELPEIASFGVSSCRREWGGTKWYDYWTFGWSLSGSDYGWGWEVIESPSIPAYGAGVASGSSGTSTEIGGYIEYLGGSANFFLRYSDGTHFTDWFALAENTLAYTVCEEHEDSVAALHYHSWSTDPFQMRERLKLH